MGARSMTGFARVRRATPRGEVTVTVKGVNHRALDIHTHLPGELEEFDIALRNGVRRRVTRGHIDVRCTLGPGEKAEAAALNRPLFEAYLAALKQMEAEYGCGAPPDAHAALRIPGMLAGRESGEMPAEMAAELEAALDAALVEFNHFREREGAAIATAMRACCAVVRDAAAQIEGLRGGALAAFRARLEERLADLLSGAGLDPQRLAQEAALLADRSDVAEETERLKVHARELDELLQQGGEIGKKLDFLLQEMNRESNTILSKTSGIGEMGLRITDLALEAKSQIERIREQALNLE